MKRACLGLQREWMPDSQRSNRLIQKSHPILKASAYSVCTVQFLHNDAQCSGGVVQVCRWNTSFQSPAYVLVYMHVFTRMSTNLNSIYLYCIIDVKMLKISSGASSVKVHLLCFCWNSLSQYPLNSQLFLQVQNKLLPATYPWHKESEL